MAEEVFNVIIRLKAECCACAADTYLCTLLVYEMNGENHTRCDFKRQWVDTVIQGGMR